jgi:lipopolysaccharide assembly outer membrane protein LptD (OstA)
MRLFFLLLSLINLSFAEQTKKEKFNLQANSVKFFNTGEGGKIIRAEGNVEADYATYKLRSNSVFVDEKKNSLEAEGNVVITDKKTQSTFKADKVNQVIDKIEKTSVIEANGNVEADYATYKLCSNYVFVDEKEDFLEAKGDVVLMEKRQKATFKTNLVNSDKDLKKVYIDKFKFEKGNIYGNGAEGSKNQDVVSLKELRISACKSGKEDKKAPEWRFGAKNGKYDIAKDEIKLYNAIFYAKDIPIFWLPYFSIKPSRTHGFLGPSVDFYGNQKGLTIPYFVSLQEKKHYFIFSPQLFIGKYEPEDKSKVNNYGLQYQYSSGFNRASFNYIYAPKAYSELEPNGASSYKKIDRYSFTSDLDFGYKFGNYGFNYNAVSDRFFRKKYLEVNQNYLKNNIFFNYFSLDNSQSLVLESARFVPIAFEKKDSLQKLDLYGNYGKRLKASSNLFFENNVNLTSFSREVGVSQSRFSNTFLGSYKTTFGILKTEVSPSLRIDLYKKNYTAEAGILTKNENENIARVIPSIFIKNQAPMYFQFKANKDYLFKLEPQVNLSITRENLNNKKILNEDSGVAFLNSKNLMSRNSIYGYDFIDEGLILTYGSKASILHKSSKSNFSVFVGQRMKKILTQEEGVNFSGYFASLDFSLSNFFNFTTEFTISEKNELIYAKSKAITSFNIFKFSFQNTFTDKSLLVTNLNVNENQYGLEIMLIDNWIASSKLIENRNFKQKNGDTARRNVSSQFGIKYKSDCITFELGGKRERYNIQDEKNKYKIYVSMMFLGV